MKHNEKIDISQVYDLLYFLGIKANFTGFFYTSLSVMLLLEQKESIISPGNQIFLEVAKTYKTTRMQVIIEINKALSKIWENSPHHLEIILQQTLTERPTIEEFISGMAKFLSRWQTA